jgi:hypothetical protein
MKSSMMDVERNNQPFNKNKNNTTSTELNNNQYITRNDDSSVISSKDSTLPDDPLILIQKYIHKRELLKEGRKKSKKDTKTIDEFTKLFHTMNMNTSNENNKRFRQNEYGDCNINLLDIHGMSLFSYAYLYVCIFFNICINMFIYLFLYLYIYIPSYDSSTYKPLI